MSYILEALKKSEAERNRHNAPMRLISDPAPARGSAPWPRVLAAALILNVAAIGGWWYWGGTAPSTDVATVQTTPAQSVRPSSEPGADATGPAPLTPPVTETARVIPAEDTVVSPDSGRSTVPATNEATALERQPDPAPAIDEMPAARQEPRAGEIIRFQSLPMAERARFPTLEFSTHLYASDPAMRRVVVNGQRAQEGDNLPGDVHIDTITESGVVVRHGGRRIAIDVVQGWRL